MAPSAALRAGFPVVQNDFLLARDPMLGAADRQESPARPAIGLAEHIGTVQAGKLAELL
jgi:hypothetical protein